MFQKSTDEVQLILFPCVNGILHEGGRVLDHCGQPTIIRSLKLIWRKEQPLVLVTMASEQCEDVLITMPSTNVVFQEENFMSNITHENLIGSVEHPISRVCSLFAAVKNAVGIALLSRTGYAGILCVANDLSTTALGIENNKDVAFQISIPADEKGCHESWDTVLGKLWDRKAGGYSQTDKFIKSMRFMIKKSFAVSLIKCSVEVIGGLYPVTKYREIIRQNMAADMEENLL